MCDEIMRWRVAAGSVAGRAHRLIGAPNQDAFAAHRGQHTLVAVVSDGCGSQPASHVGASLLAGLLAARLVQHLDGRDLDIQAALDLAHTDVLAHLTMLAAGHGCLADRFIVESMLCTLLGVAITPRTLGIFGCGDGYYGIGGGLVEVGPYADNRPPYLAYAASPSLRRASGFLEQDLRLRVFATERTVAVGSIVLATDGLRDLLAAQAELARVPCTGEAIDSLEFLREDPRALSNPDWLRRRLARLAPPPGSGRLPLLFDDTTLLVVRRVSTAEAPDASRS